MPKRTTQMVRIKGVRTVLTTINGKVTAKPAPPLEWEAQAEAVKQLKAHPLYNIEFTIAGDFNAAKRSKAEAAKAVATGIAAGEPDLRVYMQGGVLGLIEYKVTARISNEQKARHALLRKLGFIHIVIINATTEADAAEQSLKLINQWLEEIVEHHEEIDTHV